MAYDDKNKLDRREFIKRSTIAAAALAAGLKVAPAYSGRKKTTAEKKKVIVLGIDGMDPIMAEEMMNLGQLPNFDKLRQVGGYRTLGTSIPPQSPVAWANFITGANPGTHGIFAFVFRNPDEQYKIYDSISRIKPGIGIPLGDHVLPIIKRPKVVSRRQGVPFWDYLDEAGISSAVYMVPSNYPPTQSKHANHRSLSGMGTPDLLGTIGTYQYFAEDGPAREKTESYGRHCRITFKNETAKAELVGPKNNFLKDAKPSAISFSVHRDLQAKAALIKIQNHKILLKQGQWSNWTDVDFELEMPVLIPNEHVSGICRIYLKEVTPKFRLYISPININPAEAAVRISEPKDFAAEMAKELGPFYTVGFNEAFKARNNNVLTDVEYAEQAETVLQARLKMLDYALRHYKEGLLFFYFSSTDLQSHMFWWDTFKKNPVRNSRQAFKYHNHIKKLYKRMDTVLGDILKRYGNEATVIALSDHGFSYFTRFFSLNTWLRDNGYINPSYCTVMSPKDDSSEFGVDWSQTRAYGVGVNGLYLNLHGRERDGIVKPNQKEPLLRELIDKLESIRDVDGSSVIRKVYRSDEVYSGTAMKYAPDLILGFYRGYRCPAMDAESRIANKIIVDNTKTWSADHCFAAEEVPGVLFSNRSIHARNPSLIDLAPTILAEFGLSRPNTMQGKNVLG